MKKFHAALIITLVVLGAANTICSYLLTQC